ncbi:protein kinase domain-containing protein [Embleya sp. MST-111070]|uniref:protein kinase domain-containing protein n=1 Tax=Embleya sp. MST-111070 TaxID=3398231 RepID=UPI003F733676
MLTSTGGVKVLDFGIAKVLAETTTRLTATGMTVGTPAYLSPEQIEGRDVDARTDLYSLGALVYELLTGRPPFLADSPFAVMHQHLSKPRTPTGSPVEPPIRSRPPARATRRRSRCRRRRRLGSGRPTRARHPRTTSARRRGGPVSRRPSAPHRNAPAAPGRSASGSAPTACSPSRAGRCSRPRG